MILIVESNYVLEIALKQGEAEHALKILALAEAKAIRLVVPAYALVEPLHKLKRNRNQRRSLQDAMDKELHQIERSSNYANLHQHSQEVLSALASKSDADEREFATVRERVLNCAEIIPLTREGIQAASKREDLGPQDALIFSAVELFLRNNPGQTSIFANKNSKDFLSAAVSGELERLGCKVLARFEDALGILDSELEKAKPANE